MNRSVKRPDRRADEIRTRSVWLLAVNAAAGVLAVEAKAFAQFNTLSEAVLLFKVSL